MKKSLSVLLASLMLATVFASCAPLADKLDSAITLASSDALGKAEWLEERLDGNIPDDVIIGIGSNDDYGMDLTNFEDDGYIARSIGGDVLLFGKTEDGLDRAVREYAKAVDKGASSTLDTVYHEGERIEKFTIAGRDISEFTVVYNHDRDYSTDADVTFTDVVMKTLGNAKFAAEELVRLVETATGVTLPMSTEDVKTPMIKIDYITDGSCGENGFKYNVENGNLYINGATEANGCANGVYYFLEYECGWDGLMYGDSDLLEADLVDIPEGVSNSIDPIFDYANFHIIWRFNYDNDRAEFSQVYDGVISCAMHGMQVHEWSGHDANSVYYNQICYTDESNYMNTFDSVYTFVEKQVKVNGGIIGENFTTIDISQGDNLKYCMCSDCLKVYKEEGNAHSGAVVRFANHLAEDMEAEGYGGLVYQIFAYHGSNKPCKTTLRDDIYVTLCNDGSCQNHPLDGSECFGTSFDMAGEVKGMESLNNNDYAEWMLGWGKISNNVYLWHYALDTNFGQYTYFDILYDDIMLMKEANMKGLFFLSGYKGIGLGRLRFQLVNAIIYNPDITEAEYEVMRDKIMEREYGEGYDFVLDYIGIWDETQTNSGCWNSWRDSFLFNVECYDAEMYARRADEMVSLLEKALDLVSTKAQELNIKRLLAEVVYRQSALIYFGAVADGDTAAVEKAEMRYGQFLEYMLDNGYDLDAIDCCDGMPATFKVARTVQEAAANEWAKYAEELTLEKVGGQYKHVVIIGVDGAGHAWEDAHTPCLDEIFADAAKTNYCQNVTPNVSAPNWSTLLTGVVPQIHGVDNAIAGSQEYNKPDYPTVFKLVRESHPDAKLSYIGSWGSFDGGMIEPRIGLESYFASGDADVKDTAIRYLHKNKPELMFIYLGDTDHIGHDHGCESNEYLSHLNMVDDYIGQIYDALVQNGMIDDTLLIVTADHGHTKRGGHGGLTDEEKYLFFGVAGKTVIPNDNVQMLSRDLPAIVCHALGVEGNDENWDSYLPAGMFKDAPEGEIRDYNSTVDHANVATPTGSGALQNYVATSQLKTAIFFDESLDNVYGENGATLEGDITYEEGFYGSAAKLDTNNTVTFEDLKFGEDSFSIGLWLKTDVSYFKSPTLYANKKIGNRNDGGFTFEYNSDSMFNIGDPENNGNITLAMGLPDDYDKDYWFHTLLVVNREEGTVGMYYNFKLLREYELGGELEDISFDSDLPFTLGSDAEGEVDITALVDDLLIFDGALDEMEVEHLSDYYFG